MEIHALPQLSKVLRDEFMHCMATDSVLPAALCGHEKVSSCGRTVLQCWRNNFRDAPGVDYKVR